MYKMKCVYVNVNVCVWGGRVHVSAVKVRVYPGLCEESIWEDSVDLNIYENLLIQSLYPSTIMTENI